MIKINDTILVRPCFGMDPATKAKVIDMEVTKYPRQKEGTPAECVTFRQVRQNRVLFTVQYEGKDTQNWCYSDQVII